MNLTDIEYNGTYPDHYIEEAYCLDRERALTVEEIEELNENSDLVYNLIYDYLYN